VIERAYRTAEGLGIPLWCQDEAGPYQAIPQPGASWQPMGHPAHRPHEYVRGGTAKLLTLFRPATGEVRALPVAQATNAVLHPWLQQELETILAALPPPDPAAPGRQAAEWDWRARALWDLEALPPVRMLLLWDNLTGHQTPDLLNWLVARGIWPLFTPLGGSWLNLAESLQRILVHRAVAGHHPRTASELRGWLAAAVAGWNVDPTPFVWGGKRAARRQRSRERRYALAGSGGYTRQPLPRTRRPRYNLPLPNGYVHGN
jgi:hypothetical protein